jgi:excisionase family DNA binding protein
VFSSAFVLYIIAQFVSQENRKVHENITTQIERLARSLAEISALTGLSVPFLRNEVRSERLPVRRFGRRVLVLEEDLRDYLTRGSQDEDGSDEE